MQQVNMIETSNAGIEKIEYHKMERNVMIDEKRSQDIHAVFKRLIHGLAVNSFFQIPVGNIMPIMLPRFWTWGKRSLGL